MQNFILNLNLGRAIKENGLQINKSFLARLPLYKVTGEKVVLGGESGAEPLLLGLKTIDFIGKLLDTLATDTVATSLGPSPLLAALKYAEMKDTLEELKSKVSSSQ